jgi:trigger factor
MNITKNQLDTLNAVVTVSVAKEDYADKVQRVLADYRKNANIPGFRKGSVPMCMIQKQYGKSVLLDEVNKILQENLNKYISDEKLEILGNPLPVIKDDLDLEAEVLNFDFELGLVPDFTLNLGADSNITAYKIVADDKMLDEQVLRIQKQYGKLISKDTIAKTDDVSGVFVNEDKGINENSTVSSDLLNETVFEDHFSGKKIGDVIEVSTKGLFKDDHKLMDLLGLDHEGIHDLDITVSFTVEKVTNAEPAELTQELFDKLFGEGVVSSVDDLKAKIKEDAEQQFLQQADQKYYNDVTAFLLETTTFDLPKEFLIKWLRTAGENELSIEEAENEYEKSEKGLRYQLIEGKIAKDFALQVSFEDLKAYTTAMIRKQMAQFVQMNPSDEDIQGIVSRVLTNQEEVKKMSDQLMSEKMLAIFKDKVKATAKDVNYEQFVNESYGE